jgi:hypothetical protein
MDRSQNTATSKRAEQALSLTSNLKSPVSNAYGLSLSLNNLSPAARNVSSRLAK